MDFDLIIPIAAGDLEALKRNLPYIRERINASKIVVIANHTVEEKLCDMDVEFIDEDKLIHGVTFGNVKKWIVDRYPKAGRRTGWYFQQFLKLGYAEVCEKNYYMSWDSDTIPLKDLVFFSGVSPFLDRLPSVNGDEEYGKTIMSLWEDGSVVPDNTHSYITEHMMFSTDIVKLMLNEIKQKVERKGDTFAEKIVNSIAIDALNLSGFSEFELYAAYVINKYSTVYIIRDWKNLRHGKAFFGNHISEKQMEWVSKRFDVISIEDFDKQLLCGRILCDDWHINNMSFERVYSVVKPIIEMKYKIRMFIRKIVRK